MYKIENNSIDVIKCDGVLYHNEDMGLFLKNLKEYQKKIIINLVVHNRDSLWFHLCKL